MMEAGNFQADYDGYSYGEYGGGPGYKEDFNAPPGPDYHRGFEAPPGFGLEYGQPPPQIRGFGEPPPPQPFGHDGFGPGGPVGPGQEYAGYEGYEERPPMMDHRDREKDRDRYYIDDK